MTNNVLVSGVQQSDSVIHMCACSVTSVVLFATLWTIAHHAPLSTGVSRQEYQRRQLCPPPGVLPNTGTEPPTPALQVDSLPLSHQGSPQLYIYISIFFFTRYYQVLGYYSGEGNGTALQYSCLENPMGGGAWQAAVHGVAKSRT